MGLIVDTALNRAAKRRVAKLQQPRRVEVGAWLSEAQLEFPALRPSQLIAAAMMRVDFTGLLKGVKTTIGPVGPRCHSDCNVRREGNEIVVTLGTYSYIDGDYIPWVDWEMVLAPAGSWDALTARLTGGRVDEDGLRNHRAYKSVLAAIEAVLQLGVALVRRPVVRPGMTSQHIPPIQVQSDHGVSVRQRTPFSIHSDTADVLDAKARTLFGPGIRERLALTNSWPLFARNKAGAVVETGDPFALRCTGELLLSHAAACPEGDYKQYMAECARNFFDGVDIGLEPRDQLLQSLPTNGRYLPVGVEFLSGLEIEELIQVVGAAMTPTGVFWNPTGSKKAAKKAALVPAISRAVRLRTLTDERVAFGMSAAPVRVVSRREDGVGATIRPPDWELSLAAALSERGKTAWLEGFTWQGSSEAEIRGSHALIESIDLMASLSLDSGDYLEAPHLICIDRAHDWSSSGAAHLVESTASAAQPAQEGAESDEPVGFVVYEAVDLEQGGMSEEIPNVLFVATDAQFTETDELEQLRFLAQMSTTGASIGRVIVSERRIVVMEMKLGLVACSSIPWQRVAAIALDATKPKSLTLQLADSDNTIIRFFRFEMTTWRGDSQKTKDGNLAFTALVNTWQHVMANEVIVEDRVDDGGSRTGIEARRTPSKPQARSEATVANGSLTEMLEAWRDYASGRLSEASLRHVDELAAMLRGSAFKEQTAVPEHDDPGWTTIPEDHRAHLRELIETAVKWRTSRQ